MASWSIRSAEPVVGCEEQRAPEQRERLAAVVAADRPFERFERLAERDAVAVGLRGLQPDPAERDVRVGMFG